MTVRRIYILPGLPIIGLLAASFFGWTASAAANILTVAEYRAELDQLLVATQQLDSSERETPRALRDLPLSWRVSTGQRDFDISTEVLRQDVRKFEQEKSLPTPNAIRSRIQNLHNDLDGFETSPPDVSKSRERLTAILARREYGDVSGPTLLDRLA